MTKNIYLNQAQLNAEINRCLNCKTKPCMKACPVGCSPHDFIQMVKNGDYEGAAASIVNANPMGQSCGLICPDKFCMNACTRSHLDFPINIPKIQASILKHGYPSSTSDIKFNGHRIAVVGAGPAGIGAAAYLGKNGFAVVIFEASDRVGGALNLIPQFRLPHEVIRADWEFVAQNSLIELRLNHVVENYTSLLKQGFDAVIVACGEPNVIDLGIEGEDCAVSYLEYLRSPKDFVTDGNVAIIGGGAVAVDCALTARKNGAQNVEMFVRRKIGDMRITAEERMSLLENDIDLTTMTSVKQIHVDEGLLTLDTCKNHFVDGKLQPISGTLIERPHFNLVIKAIGSSAPRYEDSEKIFFAGDCKTGGSTLVEAIASGQAAAIKIIDISL